MGHSTHELDALVALLERHGATAVADVRRHPGSRRHPQFASHTLAASLPARGIAYTHLPALGGRRKASPTSVNDAWKHPSFRAYADHLGSEEFAAGLEALERLARERPTAVMCAEGMWWRCHRRLVADALTVRGWTVCHIAPGGALSEHELPEFAVVEGTRLTYPAPQLRLS
ncbi:MAG TPA: DUF488 domain-containing protein [Solirubrobacteraceae bacterium]|nr:DUF488 domain-containing protein [Solirubrobacteraceae bacterium]